jgi:DNA-binding MarR family transcriptional regulator
MTPELLTPDENAACQALIRAVATLPRTIDTALLRVANIRLHEYAVLSSLAAAPGRAGRISDLAEWVSISVSGISRLINQMIRSGFVQREHSPDDGRSQIVRLTPAGLACFEASKPEHDSVLRRLILDNLRGLSLNRVTIALEAIASSLATPPGRVPSPPGTGG